MPDSATGDEHAAAASATADGQPQDLTAPATRRSLPARGAIGCIRFYRRRISGLFPPMCRFRPTCSEYALDAIEKYGFLKGGWRALKRLLRCQPLCPGGYDPLD